MKKRIVFFIALLMILCLALTGCGQRDGNAGATNNGSEMGDPGDNQNQETTVVDVPDDYDIGTNEPPQKDADGWYTYMLDDREINLKTNIWDYIYNDGGKKVFDAIKMAEDLGWEWSDVDRTDYDTSARGPEWKRRFRLESYSGDFSSKQKYVEFFGASEHVYTISTNFDEISFDRIVLTNDGISNTFYLNGTGDNAQTVNIEEIIVSCYLFERTNENTDGNPLVQGGIYGPFDSIVIHK